MDKWFTRLHDSLRDNTAAQQEIGKMVLCLARAGDEHLRAGRMSLPDVFLPDVKWTLKLI